MFKKKTSILFVDAKEGENKHIQVPTKLLKHWRKYVLFYNFIILILMGIVAYFVYEKTSESYRLELTKANKVKQMIDVQKIEKSFKSIDENVNKINVFLKKRGLSEMNFENVGGEAYNDIDVTNVDEVAQFYSEYLEKVAEKIKKVPMGKPHIGKITSKFGYRHNPFTGRSSEKHSGIDFKGAYGSRINATADGEVFFAGVRGGYGNCVIIQHKNNIKTLYAHMRKITVKQGQKVSLGDKVGELGNTGRSTGPHLHYEIMMNDEKINPEPFFKL
ncbi:MAG: peptidase M23 [Flavobacteriales bacterium]|nr:MAG: peptidase M23 [Flavobacteriales bacterium]